ncbi:MAG: DUF1365 domain-containing protein [Pseudomonadota bacterium]
MRSALYQGSVMHHRLTPFRHRFVYSIFSLLIDLDELDYLDRSLRWFSKRRRNLLSFDNRDHGPRDGQDLKPWALDLLKTNGIELASPRIMLLSFPRVLGYVFNPLSVYFCHNGDGSLGAVIYEVKNTFGGQHCYVFAIDTEDDASCYRHRCAKQLYVSPFMDVSGGYRFKTRPPADRVTLSIDFADDAGNRMVAVQEGERRPLTDGQILRSLARTGLLTLKVMAGIHFEALRLWLKGARYFPKRFYPKEQVQSGTV